MKYSMCKALLFLCILCLGITLSEIAAADDQSGQTDIGTVGAYPGAPTPTNDQPVSQAYPAQPGMVTPATPSAPSGQPVVSSGTVGAYPGPVTSTSSVTAVYYNQAPPVAQQNVLLTYDIQTAPPTAVYYSGAYMPWTSFYQVFPASSPAIWISSSAGWSWYATCPVGSWIQELIYVPTTGSMKLYELYPDGTTKLYDYGWAPPGYKYAWFKADMPGRHIIMVTISGNPSNFITIDAA
jgi:hypothetical protein